MAPPQQAASSDSDEDFHSVSGSREDGDNVDSQYDVAHDEEGFAPPEHPLTSMQGPFEESILELNLDQRPISRSNAETRRQRLLDTPRYDDSWIVRWKQRPEAQYHPLLKLMAQITFGMHLLQQNQARSDQEVVKILQTHVDEVDNFLENTAEDFDLAVRDIDERIRFLQLPMQHIKVFNIMLDDKQFRTQLLDGNDKIEKIIDRTARAMNAALADVSKGRQAGRELTRYLNSVQHTWPTDKADLNAIYNAMRGNEEGWKKCYRDLQAKGNALGNKLIELGTIISEMSKMAAAASRRMGVQSGTQSPTTSVASSTALRSRYSADTRGASGRSTPAEKPLPRAPSAAAGAARPGSSRQRFEQPREIVPTPTTPRHTLEERPRTAGSRSGTSTPRKSPGPLSSHPPSSRPQSAGVDRANGSAKASIPTALPPRSSSQPMLSASKPGAVGESGAKTGLLSQGRDAIAGSAFARRWSIRKKHTGPKIEDYTTNEPPMPAKAKPTAGSLKSASMPRLPTADASAATSTDVPAPAKPEPKYRIGSMRLGSEKTRQSVLQNLAATETAKPEAPSIASSIKRRTLSVRNLFGRRKPSLSDD